MAYIGKERLYYMSPAANIVMEAELAAQVSAEALASAISRAAHRQASLCSRAVLNNNGEAELVPCEPAPVQVTQFEGAQELELLRSREAQTPLEPENALWMRHSLGTVDGKTIWLLSMHHVAADGLSVLYFIRDTLLALKDENLCWQTEPFMLCDPSKLGGKSPLPLRLLVGGIARGWEKEKRLFTPHDRQRVTQGYWSGRELCAVSRAIEGAELERVLSLCRANGVTLTAAICATMLDADGKASEAALAVSIRPKGFEGAANWATGITVKRGKQQKPLFEAAAEFKRGMDEKLGSEAKRNYLLKFLDLIPPTLMDASYFSVFDGLQSKPAAAIAGLLGYTRDPKGLSMTNLLRAPIDEADVKSIRFYPPLMPNIRRLVGMATVGSRLEITLQSFEPPEECERYLDKVISLITEER